MRWWPAASWLAAQACNRRTPQRRCVFAMANAKFQRWCPYAESKEMLGGFFVIQVPDLDAALEWAARAPSASCGSTEVRPALPPPPSPA